MIPNAPVPPYVFDAIAHMEASARHHETIAGELRDAIATVRREFGVSTLATPPPAAPAPSPTPAPAAASPKTPKPTPAPAQPKPKAWKGETSVDHEARLKTVMAAAQKLGGPFRMSELARAVPTIGQALLVTYINALVKAGGIKKTGVRAGTRYTVVVAAPQELRAHAGPSAVDVDVAPALMKVLASGASYDGRELLKQLRASVPSADLAAVEAALTDLVQNKKVERIATGAAPRYRKRAA